MSAVIKSGYNLSLGDNTLPYFVHPMRREDITQVSEIDREAFPTIWPPTNYARELQNPLARCLVTCDNRRTVQEPDTPPATKRGLSRVISGVWGLFNRNRLYDAGPTHSERRYIVGFASLWVIADEAHITNIAVRGSYQRQGIGELMLLASIDKAREQKANVITLEVRASNTAAQRLYQKYGFNQVGVRRGYYMDNKEDAILMTTDDINSTPFQSRLEQLKQALANKLGTTF
jgi:ribosomal-protein-alanine N-acetyltransferase